MLILPISRYFPRPRELPPPSPPPPPHQQIKPPHLPRHPRRGFAILVRHATRVNNVTGQRTYQFIRGKPVTPTQPAVSPYVVQQSPVPGPHTAPWGLPSPGYPAPAPPAVAMVPCQPGYGSGAPPVTPAGNGGLGQRLQKYYLRPSSERSWMWNRNQGE